MGDAKPPEPGAVPARPDSPRAGEQKVDLTKPMVVVRPEDKRKFRCPGGHTFEMDTVYNNPPCPTCHLPATPD